MFFEYINNDFVQEVLMMLLHHLWLGLGLFLAVACMLRYFRNLATTTRYRVWGVTLLAVAVLPLAALIPRPELAAVGKAVSSETIPAFYPPRAPLRSNAKTPARGETGPGEAAPLFGAAATTSPLAAQQPVRRGAAPESAKIPWGGIAGWLLTAWLLGVAWKLTGIARGLVVLRRVKKESRPYPCEGEILPWFREQLRVHGSRREVGLRLSSKSACPMALGFRGPVIVLPQWLVEKMGSTDLKRVILHEFAHIKRRDDWANLGQKLIEACFFYHPGVRGLSRRMDLEREVACDSWAVSVLGDARRYACCLVRVFESMHAQRRPVLAVGAVHDQNQLSRRVENLLRRPRRAGFSSIPLAATMLLLLAGGYLAFSFAAPHPNLGGTTWMHVSGDEQKEEDERAAREASAEEARALPREKKAKHEKREKREKLAREHSLQRQKVALVRQAERLERQLSRLQASRELQKLEQQNRLELAELAKMEQAEHLQELKARELKLQEKTRAMEKVMQKELEEVRRQNERISERQERLAARQGSVRGGSMSISSSEIGGNESPRLHFSNNHFEMKVHGRVVFTEDETGIEGVSKKGSFEIREKKSLGRKRSLRVRADGRGGLTYDYRVNGRKTDFDESGRQWLRDTLPEMLRDTAIGSESRMRRILERRGVAAAFDYVDKVDGDYARAVYYRVMIESDMLADEDYTSLSRQAAVIDSDYEKARVYKSLLGHYAANSEMITTIAGDLESIDSDYERAGVLSHVIETGQASDEVLGLMLKAAAGIDSDYEKAKFLARAIDRWPLATLMERGLIEAATGIDSDYEHARVLMAIFENGNPDADQMERLLEEAAESIDSDYERAKVFTRAARIGPVGPAFFKALRRIGSDYEKARVLKSIAASGSLTQERGLLMLEAAKGLDSDHEKYTFLSAFLDDHELTPALERAVKEVMKTIGSDHYHGKLSRKFND